MPQADPVTTLDVRVTERGDDAVDSHELYSYLLRADGGPAGDRLEREYSIDVAQPLVRKLSERAGKLLREPPGSGPSDEWAELAKLGHALYRTLFPMVLGKAPELVQRLHEPSGPLLVRSNETVVPWELLHDGTGFLALTRDMGRHPAAQRRAVGGRALDGIRRALIVGDPLGDLDDAAREAERLAGRLTEQGAECTLLLREDADLAGVMMELLDESYDLFHYCGHVADTPDGGLMLHGGTTLDDRALRTGAASGLPPLVFIDGHESTGVCEAFMAMGAKVVVGTRSEAGKDGSQRFAEEFYRGLLAGETAGAAVRQARLALTEASGAAWGSFVLYGNPAIQLGAAEPAVPEQRLPEPDPAVRELVDTALGRALGLRLLGSPHLLLGLMAADRLRPGIESRVGAERLARITRRLRNVVEDAARPEDGGDGLPVQSDTVARVLDRAQERAIAQGRHAITIENVAAAFIDVGGGTSARAVESCGVTLRQLLAGDSAVDGPQPAGPADTAESGPSSQLFNGDGRIRADRLDAGVLNALRAAQMVAKAQGTVIASYSLLVGFGMVGSTVLRDALAAQGDQGERAYRALGLGSGLRPGAFSERTLAALDEALAEAPDGRLGEAALLRALLADEGAAARKLLDKLGVDSEALIQELRRAR